MCAEERDLRVPGMRQPTKREKWIFGVATCLVLLSLLFPPWYFTLGSDYSMSAGYNLLLFPPLRDKSRDHFRSARIDWDRLQLQLLVIVAATGATWYFTWRKALD